MYLPLIAFFELCRILDSLNQLTDTYPLPEEPPLLLLQEMFAVVILFDIDSTTYSGSSVTFSLSNSSDSGFTEDDIVLDATDGSNGLASISLSDSLSTVLEGHEDSRVVFTAYATEGLFLEREEYININNLTNYTLGSVVVSARVSGGVAVSSIENVVRLTFVKNQVVRRLCALVHVTTRMDIQNQTTLESALEMMHSYSTAKKNSEFYSPLFLTIFSLKGSRKWRCFFLCFLGPEYG